MLVKGQNAIRLNIYNILLAIFFGLVVDLILCFIKKKEKLILIIIFSFIGLIYMLESYLYKMYNTFYNIAMIKNMAADVMRTYIIDILKLVFDNYLILILNLLPIVLLIVHYRKEKPLKKKATTRIVTKVNAKTSVKAKVTKKVKIRKHVKLKYDYKQIILFMPVLVIFILNIILFAVTSKNLMSEYSFSDAVYKYGLNTGIVMDIMSGIKKSNYNLGKSETLFIENKSNDNEYNMLDLDFDAINEKNAKNYNIKNLNAYVSSLTPSKKNEYTGLFKGKNLIMICAESFYAPAVNEKLMPTIYRLLNNGFRYTDYYSALSNISTTAGEFQYIMGLIPALGGQCMRETINHDNYFTIANQMKRIGYNTACFHDGNYFYYNRDITHENFGYEYYMAMGNGLEKLIKDRDDFELFDKTIDLYKDKKPFSVYYMTYDCHLPYHIQFPKYKQYFNMINEVYGDDITYETKIFYAKMISFDRALENLLKKLEECGLLDDTVICMAADHYPYGLQQYNDKSIFDVCGYSYTKEEIDKRDKNSMTIWCTDLEKDTFKLDKNVKGPTYSVDVLPTLSNLFGLEYDSRLLVGRDVFSEVKPLVIWDNYSFKTEDIFYNSITKTITKTSDKNVSEDEIADLKRIVSNKIDYSKDVVIADYFKYLFADKKESIVSSSSQLVKKSVKNKQKKEATYKDIAELQEKFQEAKCASEIKNVESPDDYETVKFGRYEQDGNVDNGKEDIEWIILQKYDGAVLLVSKYILDTMPYDEDSSYKIWDDTTVRKFLNNDFYNESFNSDEKNIIFNMMHKEAGVDYIDKIYMLNEDECKLFFGLEPLKKEYKKLATSGTEYAKKKGLFVKDFDENWYDGNSIYWLIPQDLKNTNYPQVEYNGFINRYAASHALSAYGVRPVISVVFNKDSNG